MTTAAGVRCALCGLGCGRRPVAREDRSFCCAGCANVYAILRESGVLASGQDFRETEVFRQSLKLGLISNPDERERANTLPEGAEIREAVFQVSGMWCASCAWLIEHVLARERGVAAAGVFFASDLLKVKYCPRYVPPERIVERVAALGYRAVEYAGHTEGGGRTRRDLLLRLGVAGFLWLNVMTLSMVLYVGYFERIAGSVSRFLPLVLLALATPAVFYSAAPILRIALLGLRRRVIRMETLLALGILAAYGYSAVAALRGATHFYFDTACAIVTLVLAGKLAEQSAKEKAASGVALLYGMMPKKARLLAEGRERFVALDALERGTVFVVKPGERIPADGVVVEGRSHVDESVLTGESRPRARGPGDRVVCGSLNGGGVLEVRATGVGADSTLAHIIRAVETALSGRSNVERQVDRVSRVFVPVVMAIAVAAFCGWLAGTGQFSTAMMRAIAVLIIACPCALGIATPLAIATAIGTAARLGILVSDSRALETIRKVDTVVLDKTGTVTEGEFTLLEAAGDLAGLGWVASLEAYSQHPLARALCGWAEARGLKLDPARGIVVHEGRGISGEVAGRRVFAGNRRMCPCEPGSGMAGWEDQGRTVVFFGWDGAVRGALAFGDRVKPDAARLVARLHQRGIRTVLVSGDARTATAFVAGAIGASNFLAETLPDDKVDAVREWQRSGAVVAMLGDGVNDAPSLARADLGIALGSGADIAVRAAPVVIMSGRLDSVIEVIDLARAALDAIRQNLFWAFLYNTAGITLAAAGVLNPILAAAAMVLSSMSVIWNSRRWSRRWRPPGR